MRNFFAFSIFLALEVHGGDYRTKIFFQSSEMPPSEVLLAFQELSLIECSVTCMLTDKCTDLALTRNRCMLLKGTSNSEFGFIYDQDPEMMSPAANKPPNTDSTATTTSLLASTTAGEGLCERGNLGSSNFDSEVTENFGRKMIQIHVEYDAMVYFISLEYGGMMGFSAGKNSVGATKSIITLDSDEYVVEVSASQFFSADRDLYSYNNVLTGLTFKTDRGTVYGPYGDPDYFSGSVAANSFRKVTGYRMASAVFGFNLDDGIVHMTPLFTQC